MAKCPYCKEKAAKVIYTGFPMKFCANEECSLLWGFWSFIPDWFGFDGKLHVYKGSYWKALWYWLTVWEWPHD